MTNYIEDYIELIGADRHSQHSPYIKLARYDVNVVRSFCKQIKIGQGFTDRQATLATVLVTKYKRQLALYGIVVPDDLVFRFPIRAVQREYKAWIEDHTIYLQFPYNSEWIDLLREWQDRSPGYVGFLPSKKIWQFDLTEGNIQFVYQFTISREFQIDNSIISLNQQIIDCLNSDYKIELTRVNNQLTITNADDSLLEYITTIGGLTEDNLPALIDNAAILKYSIAPNLIDTAKHPLFYHRDACIQIVNQSKEQITECIERVIQYATDTNRFPIYLYTGGATWPSAHDIENIVCTLLPKDEIVHVSGKKQYYPTKKYKVIITDSILRNHTKLPLLISTMGMMFGDKQLWVQGAEKIVYIAETIYTNYYTKGQEIFKLNENMYNTNN